MLLPVLIILLGLLSFALFILLYKNNFLHRTYFELGGCSNDKWLLNDRFDVSASQLDLSQYHKQIIA